MAAILSRPQCVKIAYRINKFRGPKQNDLLYVLINRYYLKLHNMPTGSNVTSVILSIDDWMLSNTL